MTEMVKTTNNTVALFPDSKESTLILADKMEDQLDGLKPVLDFYGHLVNGWHQRILLAEKALKEPGNQGEGQQALFFELRNAAKIELEKYLPVYKEVQEIREQIKNRLREFDVMQLKKAMPKSTGHQALIDFKEVRELMHQADALIELRGEE